MKKGLDCADKFFFSCQSDVTSTRAVFDSVNAHGGNKTQSNTDRQTVVVVVVVVVFFRLFVCFAVCCCRAAAAARSPLSCRFSIHCFSYCA
jgi:hypothetical protein